MAPRNNAWSQNTVRLSYRNHNIVSQAYLPPSMVNNCAVPDGWSVESWEWWAAGTGRLSNGQPKIIMPFVPNTVLHAAHLPLPLFLFSRRRHTVQLHDADNGLPLPCACLCPHRHLNRLDSGHTLHNFEIPQPISCPIALELSKSA